MERQPTQRAPGGAAPAPVAAYGAAAALVMTAFARLWTYQLAARVRGRSPERALRILQRWCQWARRPLRLQVQVYGTPPVEPHIYVANHRTYLDIPVLCSVLGASFLSRADVAQWPLVGAVAKEVGVVFVERDDPRGRVRAARALLRRAAAASVIVFPEGTTRGERLPGDFHAGLFRLVHRTARPVVPVTVRYSDRRAYWTDLTLWEHMRTQVLAGAPLQSAVHIGAPLATRDYADDVSFAQAVYAAVCRPIEELGEFV